MTATKPDCQSLLEAELERLKRILKLGFDLKVKWIPNNNFKISGEVKHRTILVYDDDKDVAIQTLKHEVVDYLVSKTIEPYQEVTNRLIALINEIAYKRKEQLVEIIGCLLN